MIARRRFLGFAAASAVLPLAGKARSQERPGRSVRLVVPFTPAGANDSIARILAAQLSDLWGQPVVIENKPGAGGTIGTEAVARSLPDGTTLLFTSIAHAVNRFLYSSLKYDPVADFSPVTLVCLEPNVMAVSAASTVRSVPDFIQQAKARAGGMSYASAGHGTSLHLCGELFKRMAGVDLVHVPYKGSAPAVADLISGRVDVIFGSTSSMLPQIRAGRLRGIAVTTSRRAQVVPDLPTVSESGVPGFDMSSWFAVFAPAATPPAMLKTVHSGVASVLRQSTVRERFSELGSVVVASTPEELALHLDSEMRKWGALIKAANIRVDG